MSAGGDAQAPHEVVIVRRRGGDDDDGYHGGAWKIALADLMTALMTFFLVMWLISVSDREKIHKIATYFNPMNLNAKRPTAKGAHDESNIGSSSKGTSAEDEQNGLDAQGNKGKLGDEGARRDGGDGSEREGKEKRTEEELFNDPYGVLARLALEAELADEAAGSGQADSLKSSGDAYSNPFEPFSERKAEPERSETIAKPSPLPPEEARVPDSSNVGVNAPPLEANPVPAESPPASAERPSASRADVKPPAPAMGEAEEKSFDARVMAVAEELKKVLQALPANKKPSLDVTVDDDGVLISLTDDFQFGMFATSSARPTPELVVVMEKVGQVLAQHPGELVIRGHTDGRQYRTQKNKNWRLSLSRAEIAYYMLLRGGVEESRVSRIEGHADRELKVPDDPYAAQNRRIEILLKVPKT